MKTTLAIITATAAAVTLALTPAQPDVIVLEHDPDLRAICVGQLLNHDQHQITMDNVIGTLNYTDRYYGGPCAALDHYNLEGWY